MKKKILLACPMQDQQTGVYLFNSLVEVGHSAAFFDWKNLLIEQGQQGMNDTLVKVIEKLQPDLTIICKGLGIWPKTIDRIREVCDHKIVGWIFDVTLGGHKIQNVGEYMDFISKLDKFYTIDKDFVKEVGKNTAWLSEGCRQEHHKEVVLNSVQKHKYGAPVVFIGGVGTIHPNREKILKRLWDEGIPVKIYGEVHYPEGKEPEWVKDFHTGYAVINDMHSTVVNSSQIVLGIDGWPDREGSWSARLYRTMCAGGFYLTTHTKGIEKEFKPGTHLDTYRDENEMVEKIMYYLQNDAERERIARQGQEEVLKKHNFTDRIKVIVDDNLGE